MVFALPTGAGALFFPLFLLVDSHFVTDDATHGGAGQGVVMREMSGDPADDRAADAAGLSLAGNEDGGDQAEQYFRSHDQPFL